MSEITSIQLAPALIASLARSLAHQEEEYQKDEEPRSSTAVIFTPRPARIAKIYGLTVTIWAKEHPPPHFHVDFQGDDASFSILTCKRLAGSKGLRKFEKTIREWWEANQKTLIDAWNSSRPSNCSVGPMPLP